MDYGRTLTFGYFPVPDAAQYRQLVQDVRLCEELGLDLVGRPLEGLVVGDVDADRQGGGAEVPHLTPGRLEAGSATGEEGDVIPLLGEQAGAGAADPGGGAGDDDDSWVLAGHG